MKIKKSMSAQAPVAGSNGAIADRFRLDPIDTSAAKGSTSKKAATYALIFGLIALAVAGVLTFTIYKHWEFLMPA